MDRSGTAAYHLVPGGSPVPQPLVPPLVIPLVVPLVLHPVLLCSAPLTLPLVASVAAPGFPPPEDSPLADEPAAGALRHD
jgi:hypothetical protein